MTKIEIGYVLWGSLALLLVVVPSALAYLGGKDVVPFPTAFRTVAFLARRWHWVAMVILAGLAVLVIHLAFYPWPDIAH